MNANAHLGFHGQNEDPHHHHHHHHQQHNNANGQQYDYSANGGLSSNDLTGFYHHDSNSIFDPNWSAVAAVDPRLQGNAFAQGSSSWPQNTLNSFNNPALGYHSQIPTGDDAIGYPGLNGPQYQSFATPSFDRTFPYSNGPSLDNPTFHNQGSHEYSQGSLQDQTISPSSLQRSSTSWMQPEFLSNADNQSANFRHGHEAQQPSRGLAQAVQSPRQPYDEQTAVAVASSIPDGSLRNGFLVRDSPSMLKATNSQKFTGFIYIGTKAYETEEPKTVLPRLPIRASIKDLKRKALEDQGDRLWDSKQRHLMKRLKLSVPKAIRSQTRPIGVGSTGAQVQPESPSESSVESDSEEDSDSESDYGNEPEAPEPFPLSGARPTEPGKAIEYDVVKTVWARRNAHLSGEEIRTALGTYQDIIKKIREDWKSEALSQQKAEDKKDLSLANAHKARALVHRDILDNVLRLTTKHGHGEIVKKLSEIPLLFVVFYNCFVDLFKAEEYNAPLAESILSLMVQLPPVDPTVLEKTKLGKVIPKLVKRSDGKVKSLAQQVLDLGGKLGKQDGTGAKGSQAVESKVDGTAKAVPGAARTSVHSIDAKSRAASTASLLRKPGTLPQTKPVAALMNRAPPLAGKGVPITKSDGKVVTGPLGNTGATLKEKVKHVAAKPSLFASLQSASKKPGTLISTQKLAQQNDTQPSKPAEAKPAAAVAPKPAFSFAETMANLNKPKEVETKIKPVDDRPPETYEEKKKRLRKEERRKLRVSWKAGDELVEVRLFKHDPEEELGHDAAQVRDVDDLRSEGRRLKEHREASPDSDEEDESDQMELIPWSQPTMVDFSTVDASELERNCTTRGGSVEIYSAEKAAQEQRELTTLIAIYSSLSDVPYSPREPVDPYSGNSNVVVEFGAPQAETKRREQQFFASQHQGQQPYAGNALPTNMAQTPDISALLQILNNQEQAAKQQQQQQQAQQQVPQFSSPTNSALESIFAQFAIPATQPQAVQIDPNFQAAINLFNATQMGQAAPPAVQQQVQQIQQPLAPQAQDLSSLLAQFTQQGEGQAQQGYSYLAAYQQQENERKRQYEAVQRSQENAADGKRQKGNTGKKVSRL